MSVEVAQRYSRCPLVLGIQVIEAAARMMLEETSLDVLHLERQARGFLDKAVEL